MQARNTRSGIINITSQAATIMRGRSFIYSPTKRFEDVFTQSLAYEVDSKQIDIMSVRPAFFATKLIGDQVNKRNVLVLSAG